MCVEKVRSQDLQSLTPLIIDGGTEEMPDLVRIAKLDAVPRSTGFVAVTFDITMATEISVNIDFIFLVRYCNAMQSLMVLECLS